MGSESDWPVMEGCVAQLDALGLEADVQVLSAHRTPARLTDYVQRAVDAGVEVFIAAAGMSAALPGVIAAHTTAPVIGVPMPSGPLQGVDALLAISQMPPGVPVATVALGAPGARNAALLAAQILAVADEKIAQKLQEHKRLLDEKTDKSNQTLREKLQGR
jgi:phosphoribosylaminoimidazole carboxylase PurE protein